MGPFATLPNMLYFNDFTSVWAMKIALLLDIDLPDILQQVVTKNINNRLNGTSLTDCRETSEFQLISAVNEALKNMHRVRLNAYFVT